MYHKKSVRLHWRLCLVLSTALLIILQSCRKDHLLPNSPTNSTFLSVNEAKQYFQDHIKNSTSLKTNLASGENDNLKLAEYFKNKTPLWNKAREKIISVGGAVKIPLDMGLSYAVVSKKKRSIVPFSSLNYLLMYKDSLQAVHTEWVQLMPDSAWLYGKREHFTGQIGIRDWSGNVIKAYNYNPDGSYKQIFRKPIATQTNNRLRTNDVGNWQWIEIRVKKPDSFCTCDDKSNCDWMECDVCGELLLIHPPMPETPDPPTGPTGPTGPGTGTDGPGTNPGGSGGNGSGGSGSGGGDYPPNCNPDPNYVVPDYPAPNGEDWIMPCSDDVPLPNDTDPPNNPSDSNDGDIVGDDETIINPETNQSISFSQLMTEVESTSNIDDLLDHETVGTPFPSIMVYPTIQILEAGAEVEVLHILHPQWSTTRIVATAIWHTWSGKLHFLLDVGGTVPVIGEVADVINGGIYYLEGDNINCALSLASALPVYGWVSTAGKWVRKAGTSVAIQTIPVGSKAYRAYKTTKGGVRMIKVAVTTFSHASVKALTAIKPADHTLTNISMKLVDQFSHRVKPIVQSLRTKIDNIISHGDDTGLMTESIADDIFATDNYFKFDAKIGSNNGFDGVYIKKDASGNVVDVIINEAKQIGTAGNIKLGTTVNKGPQMSDQWINSTINEMRQSSNIEILNLGNTLFNNRSLITKTVTGVDRVSGEIVILKLSSY